ncbi:YceD family protein [Hydrogenothermus marinus]|uniref:DUF177 domain-containing protein n=1 Tax=Hydrogenothermus marinus TaxID=133270 RepID=A0A3M0BAF8_9AQUI|nr:DUF177 domain-containing protein [Hydrogenothermus marinus]RMA93149.1 uncharacterized protein CLV39_1484 [Hydrogenothermus marinus]
MHYILNLKNEFKNKEENFIEKDYEISFRDLDLPSEYSSDKDVKIHMYIIKEKDGYAISMDFKSNINLECSRCLEHFDMDLSETSNIFLSKKKLQSGELHKADLDMKYLEDEEHFDLNEFVREEILVKTPMKPLCDENCKGICPICGANRNENPCDCEKKERRKNSPFAKLEKLLKK